MKVGAVWGVFLRGEEGEAAGVVGDGYMVTGGVYIVTH